MKFETIKFSAFALFFTLFSFAVAAQQLAISGVVKDAQTGEFIIGANVIEKGTSNGSITDIDGHFSFFVSSPSATLLVSYIGYTPQELAVAGKQSFIIELSESAIALKEVVAIGYGSQTKKEITGSISSVKPEDFNQGVVSNAMGLLQGKVAGLTIIKNGGDDPAQNSYQVQLRGVGSLHGSSEPLYVIDGVPGGNLSTVLPSDIESIDVLKDGSAAAIYGTRANAGVILITTKRGGGAGKAVSFVEYNGTLSGGMIAQKPRVLNSNEYREKMVENGLGVDLGGNTNWINAITRNSFSHTHSLSLSGGAENFNYRASVGYRQMQGVAIKSDYEEKNIRFAANQKALKKKLDIAYDFSYTTNTKTWSDYDNFNQAVRSNPTMPIRSDEERFVKFGGYYKIDGFYSINPVARMEQTDNDQKDKMLLASVRASLELYPGLKLTSFYSLQETGIWNGKYQKSTLDGVENKGGVASQAQANNVSQVVENTLQYIAGFGAHNLQAMLGQAYQYNVYSSFNAENTLFPLDKLSYNNLGLGMGILDKRTLQALMGSSKYSDKLASFFARAMYSYNNRYYLNASVRFEGSSKFGKKANELLGPWGIFPSVSASWRIDQEDFMKDIDFIDDLKLRVGYGVTGNMPSDSYLYLVKLQKGSSDIFSNENWIQPWGIASNQNERIRWEKKHEYNLGIDFAALSNRLSITLDAYMRNTTDLLYEYNVPSPPNPVARMWDNYGKIHNYGLELSVNGVVLEQKDLSINIGLVAAANRNKVVRISSGYENGSENAPFLNVGFITSGDGETGNYVMRLQEGKAIGNFYGYKYYGINKKGEWVFETPAGGFTTNPQESDKMILGNAQPLLNFGFNAGIRYKEFDFSMNFRGQLGGLIFNEMRYFYENTRGAENVLLSAFEGEAVNLTKWIEDTNNVKASQRKFSDFYLENATYIKLNDLSIGYNPVIGGELGNYINSLRVAITGQNLLTITGYKGMDPEVSMSGLTPGFDSRAYYPKQRSVNLSLSFKF